MLENKNIRSLLCVLFLDFFSLLYTQSPKKREKSKSHQHKNNTQKPIKQLFGQFVASSNHQIGSVMLNVPSLMVADHTVSSVSVSMRDSLKGGGCSKNASK